LLDSLLQEISSTKMAKKNFVPRINQLDAATLDTEIISTFSQKISDAFKFFLRNPLDTVGPELDALLRIIIWKFTIFDKHRTIGQELLGIKFNLKSRFQLLGLAGSDIIFNYLKQRQSELTKILSPFSETTNNKLLHYLSILTNLLRLSNSLLFLRLGIYPSLATCLLDLRPISTVEESRSVGYSYMSRELLWSTFTELLIFLVPLLNSSKLKSRITQKMSSLLGKPSIQSSIAKCSACTRSPILPCKGRCGHILCYYCMATHIQSSLRCPSCQGELSEDNLVYMA